MWSLENNKSYLLNQYTETKNPNSINNRTNVAYWIVQDLLLLHPASEYLPYRLSHISEHISKFSLTLSAAWIVKDFGEKCIDVPSPLSSYVTWSGPPGLKIKDANKAVAIATGLRSGNYKFRLTVTDQQRETASAVLTVTIKEGEQNQANEKLHCISIILIIFLSYLCTLTPSPKILEPHLQPHLKATFN